MTVTLGDLNLGVVNGLSFSDRKRLEDVDLPTARGSSSQDLGELASTIELSGILRGPSRFDDFKQLQRFKRLGNSLKLDSDAVKTVVFVKEVKLVKIGVNILRYGLSLKESLFKQVNSCDGIADWSSSTTGAVVAIVSDSPTPFEGLGCLKVSHNAEAAEEVNVTYEPLDSIDLEDFDWVSFAWLMDNISEITSAVVSVTEGVHTATYDFSALLTESDKWLRLRIHKTSFANFGDTGLGTSRQDKTGSDKVASSELLFRCRRRGRVRVMGEYKNVLFKDSFIGTAGYPPDRGKWFAFLTRENSSVDFTDGTIEPTVNGCRFAAAVDSSGWGSLNLMSRAEFKVPFKIRVAVKPTDFGFFFYLLSPDVRDGHFLGTEVYGMWVADVYGTTADNKFKFVLSQNYSPKINTSAVSWSLGTEYIIEMEVTPYSVDTSKMQVVLTIKLASDGSTVWEISDWCDPSLSGTLRCAFSAMANASDSIEFYAKSLLVFGNQSRKAKAIVSSVTGLEKRVITDDVIDFRVALRDGSHPQASLTIKNEGNKYDELSVKSEIEIRAGTEAILYLLFRGYIEAPERSYPPSRLKIESSKGYAKRLDFREAYGKTYTNKTCGFIVIDLIKTYFEGIFAYDNVLEGIATSAEYNAVTISKIIKELADANVFVWGVDFNKTVYFYPFSLARSQSSIPFKSKSDQFNISNRDIDEVVNYVHQVGKTSSPGTILPWPTHLPEISIPPKRSWSVYC